MKIVNPSPQDSESQHSNELLHLDHEINLLQAKFQKCLQSDISGAPEEDVFARALKRAERENKLAIIAVLENSIEEIESVLDYVDCLTGPTVPANFPLFGELPIELRLKICKFLIPVSSHHSFPSDLSHFQNPIFAHTNTHPSPRGSYFLRRLSARAHPLH